MATGLSTTGLTTTGLTTTGLTTTGLTTTGLPNRATGDRAAPALSTAAATKLRPRNRAFIRMLIRALLRTRIPGASRSPLASNAIARGASRGVRAIPHCSCLLMRPRAGPVLRRQLGRRKLGRRRRPLRPREPSKTSPRQTKEERRRPPELAELRRTVAQHRSQTTEPSPEPSAKVIEFPRSAAIPVFQVSDLADPVFDHDRPRIVEAPEILPPPPALGGMLIEPAPARAGRQARRLPLRIPVSIALRIDSSARPGCPRGWRCPGNGSGGLCRNFSSSEPQPEPGSRTAPDCTLDQSLAAALAVVAVLLWKAYEFLFVVYTGSTPGLRAARLRLAEFDGSPLNRRLRRWRVLASFLSAFSAGLGYLWCVLDQDGLCWHDRITRTHVQSQGPTR